MSFAAGTSVDESRSRAEIERMLQKAGASSFGSFSDYARKRAEIGFTYKHIHIRMEIMLPADDEKRFLRDGRGSIRTPARRLEEYQAECRRRWRCLSLVLKAKLIAVEDGITTLEREFLPYMVMADGRTLAERMAPAIAAAQAGPGSALLLPGGAGGEAA